MIRSVSYRFWANGDDHYLILVIDAIVYRGFLRMLNKLLNIYIYDFSVEGERLFPPNVVSFRLQIAKFGVIFQQ